MSLKVIYDIFALWDHTVRRSQKEDQQGRVDQESQKVISHTLLIQTSDKV